MLKSLQFHRITSSIQFCGTWNFPGQLDAFIKFIYDSGYEIVLPGQGREGIIITFDDGEENLFEYAMPILKKYHCPAIIFLVVGYIGKKNYWDISLTKKRNRHLSMEQILKMKEAGIAFGSHTMTHRNLTRLNQQELEYELKESKRILEAQIGPIDSISYPFNRVNSAVLKMVQNVGYKYGFGGNGKNNLLIKKEAIYITDNTFSLRVKISETPKFLYNYELLKQKVINFFTIFTMLKNSKKKVFPKNYLPL